MSCACYDNEAFCEVPGKGHNLCQRARKIVTRRGIALHANAIP